MPLTGLYFLPPSPPPSALISGSISTFIDDLDPELSEGIGTYQILVDRLLNTFDQVSSSSSSPPPPPSAAHTAPSTSGLPTALISEEASNSGLTQDKWTLEHRFLREVPPPRSLFAGITAAASPEALERSKRTQPRWMQFLTLSFVPDRSFVCISPSSSSSSTQSSSTAHTINGHPAPQQNKNSNKAGMEEAGNQTQPGKDAGEIGEENKKRRGRGETGEVIAISHPTGSDEFLNLLRQKMTPLWTAPRNNPQLGLNLVVTNGVSIDTGEDWMVRVGEVRAPSSSTASALAAPSAAAGGASSSGGGGLSAVVGMPIASTAEGSTPAAPTTPSGTGGGGVGAGMGGLTPSPSSAGIIAGGTGTRPPGTIKGVIVELSWSGDTASMEASEQHGANEEENERLKEGEKLLEAFWERLGINPGKGLLCWGPPSSSNAIEGNGEMKENDDGSAGTSAGVDGDGGGGNCELDLARGYCELLRANS